MAVSFKCEFEVCEVPGRLQVEHLWVVSTAFTLAQGPRVYVTPSGPDVHMRGVTDYMKRTVSRVGKQRRLVDIQ